VYVGRHARTVATRGVAFARSAFEYSRATLSSLPTESSRAAAGVAHVRKKSLRGKKLSQVHAMRIADVKIPKAWSPA